MSEINQKNNSNYSIIINKGISWAKEGNFSNAKIEFLKAIKYNKLKTDAYINLSNIYILKKEFKNSTDLLSNYILEIGFQEQIANHLGTICYKYNFKKELSNLFKISNLSSKNLGKEKKYLFFLQGQIYEKENNLSKAKLAYLNSISCFNLFFESYLRLFELFESTNKIDKLKNLLELAYQNFKENEKLKVIYLYKSILQNREKKFTESQNTINKNNLEKYFSNNEYYLTKIYDTKSKNYEKLDKYHDSFVAVKNRNKIISNLIENKAYDRNRIIDTIKKYKNFFLKKNYLQIKKNINYPDDSNLVFLVGFPRSGTTLLDSILRTHSKINVLEEKPILLELRHKYFIKNNNNLESLKKMSQQDVDEIRLSYFNEINKNIKLNKKIIIDKLPLSIIELGFIKSIFPNSKIILAMRHPGDVITSCYFSSFKINDAMINFLDLKNTVDFYENVFSLFEFYEKEIQLKFHIIKYENVVANFYKEINLLLDFLNLNYEDKLEKFHITAKKREKIFTPSYNQVINPLYKSSIGRWKNFKEILIISKKLEKWIKKFNY